MEATAVSIGKAVLDGALGYAKSVVAEQIALQLGVERDVVFIGDELEMMQSFLMAVDEEHDKNKVLLTWVKQVREVAYNVEDNLMDFALYSDSKKRFWWCIPGILWKRRDIAKEVKELKAKVEDVSNRNLRYRLIKGSGSKSTTGEEQASVASASTFGINEARRVAKEREKLKANLHLLITSDEKDLRVIVVWGTSGDLGKTSAIREAYSHQDIYKTFGCIAWVMPTNPFNPNEFFHNLLRQFYVYSHEITEKSIRGNAAGYDVLKELEKMEWSHIIDQVSAYVNERRYLIVIDGISTIVEWDWIKTYFPDKKNGSRIIVSTQHVEIATLCTEQPYQVTELKQLSSEHAIYLFHKAKAMPASDLTGPSSNPNVSTTNGKNSAISNGEMQKEEQIPKDIGGNNVCTSSSGKKFEHSQTIALVDDEPIGRKTDKSKVIDLISQTNGEEGCKVISVWGMGGLGKTTLARSVYRSQQLGGWKRAWVTALHPFNREVILRSIALQLQKDIQDDPAVASGTRHERKAMTTILPQELTQELTRLLEMQKCLIVVDDLSSIQEWDSIKENFEEARCILVTTREKNVADYCSREEKNIYGLKGLKEDAALNLFKQKVFKENTENDDLCHDVDMMEQARLILKKCDGLPLAICTIGGFLATKPKMATEWRKMNDCISAALEIDPGLKTIKTVLMRSYDGLPYHLKSSFFIHVLISRGAQN